MWPFKKRLSPIEAEAMEAVALFKRRNDSPEALAAWVAFRNAGLERRGVTPITPVPTGR